MLMLSSCLLETLLVFVKDCVTLFGYVVVNSISHELEILRTSQVIFEFHEMT